ncbi:MAG TPA: glucuronate isomerase [Limnochordia bacterium]
MRLTDEADVRAAVRRALDGVRITDIHTHLFAPEFGELLLWGPDALLTYHYLIAETMRWLDLPYEAFWALETREQADLVWKTLFCEHTPSSESCRGVLTTLARLGLDVGPGGLGAYREFAAQFDAAEYVDRILELARVECVTMTNDPFDPAERAFWLRGEPYDRRFRAVLRIDPLLNQWGETAATLSGWGYGVDAALSATALREVRRFLEEWIERMRPLYMAVSLPPDFAFPEDSARGRLIAEAVLPVSREHNVPFALMIGVKRGVNPALRSAGDALGLADLSALERLVAAYPKNKFLVTVLARENQHALAVLARKFRNLMVFGCWWFMNIPALVDEITRMRFELLGFSVIPQHSDARILDQLVYKWEHAREAIGRVLVDQYTRLLRTGWPLETEIVERDVAALVGSNFWEFLERSLR